MVGLRLFGVPSGSGTLSSSVLATHWFAPAGLFSSSHSKPNRLSRYRFVHFVGSCVQVTSMPLVIASDPTPEL